MASYQLSAFSGQPEFTVRHSRPQPALAWLVNQIHELVFPPVEPVGDERSEWVVV
jgi:hypothetical protein